MNTPTTTQHLTIIPYSITSWRRPNGEHPSVRVIQRTNITKAAFLTALAQHNGDVGAACKAQGLKRTQVANWRSRDVKFRDAMDAVKEAK